MLPKLSSKHLFWFIVGINFLNYLDRYTLPAVLEPLGRELLLTDEQRGLLGSAFLLTYLFAAPLFGVLGDRFNRPKIISLAIAFWSLATAATWFVHDFSMLLFLRAIVGMGEAAYYGLGVAMLCDLIPERERAGKLTYFFLAIPLGSAIGFGLSGALAQTFGWRWSFLVCGLPGLLVAFAMWFVNDPEKGANDIVKDETRSLTFWEKMQFLFTHRIWLVSTICYIGYTFAMGALTHWSAAFLERQHQINTGHAGLIFGAMAATTGIIGTLAGGFITQKFQSRWNNIDVYFSTVTILLGALGILGYLLLANLVWVLISLFFGMLFLFANTTPVNNLTITYLPASIRAWGASINVFLIHLLGDALSPGIVGIISDRTGASGTSLSQALLISVPALFASGVVLLWARRLTKV